VNRTEYVEWMKETGYTDINDWNFQSIDDHLVYWIRNHLGYFALIREKSRTYEVLITGFKDFGCFTRTK